MITETKYLLYAISTIRDVFNYNYHKDLTEDVINRIEKELALIEDIEDNPYTSETYYQFSKDLLNLNMSLLPNSQKVIDEIKKKPKTVTIDSINIDGVEMKAKEPIELEIEPCTFEEAIENLSKDQQERYRSMFNFFRDDSNFTK